MLDGVDCAGTWQDFTTMYAGSLPKYVLVQGAVPEMVLVTQALLAPYRTV
ncbi:MAG: hypothetical protein KIT17_18405 [Rubrivivax sp.]|nr:hypothetical protein [Rubrivivax sp.]